MHPLYSIAELRRIEQAAQSLLPAGSLMQGAGGAAAQIALELIPHPRNDADILVLAGPGNNGGDALEAAHRLAESGLQVTVVMAADPAKLPQDARAAFGRAQASAVPFVDLPFFADIAPTRWALVIDGLFGIGLTRPIAGEFRTLVEYVNHLDCPVLALDLPSGLDADTGNIVGTAGIAVRATHCITFIADKPGLHTGFGRDYAGQVSVASLDIASSLLPASLMSLNAPELFQAHLHRRSHNSHKGSFGDVAIVGGARGMGGAPILAARAAAFCGAGRVFVGFVDDVPAYDSGHPELMCRRADTIDLSSAIVVIGPGLGTASDAQDLLAGALNSARTAVLDADALNLIAKEPGLQQKLIERQAPTLLTPHPLEAARLLGVASGQVQADRIAATRALAQRFQSQVILKGSGSVIAQPDGGIVINPTGNPALATAGSGDVLAGVCGALAAQGLPIWEAALAAVWMHGQAADDLVAQGIGPIGLTAGELAPAIRAALNRLTYSA